MVKYPRINSGGKKSNLRPHLRDPRRLIFDIFIALSASGQSKKTASISPLMFSYLRMQVFVIPTKTIEATSHETYNNTSTSSLYAGYTRPDSSRQTLRISLTIDVEAVFFKRKTVSGFLRHAFAIQQVLHPLGSRHPLPVEYEWCSRNQIALFAVSGYPKRMCCRVAFNSNRLLCTAEH